MGWYWGNGVGVLGDFLEEGVNGGIELGIFAVVCGVRHVAYFDIGFDTATFDEPIAFGSVYAPLSGGCDTTIDESV